MKKTITIDIAGQLFRIDEDVYELLSNYLKNIAQRFSKEPGGEETINDIETRIAEIFGGGQEPPVVVSEEMFADMISIMGAPEDFNDEASKDSSKKIGKRSKYAYNPTSLSAKAGKAMASFWKTVGKFFYMIFRLFMIIAGSSLSLFGFVMLFSFIVMLFFNGTPLVKDLIEPDITNINTLLSIVLNTGQVSTIMIFSALVIIIPLAALTYLGIVMVFNLKGNSKLAGIVLLSVWLVSVAVLGVLLSARLSVYSNSKSISSEIELTPEPDTIYLAPQHKMSELQNVNRANVESSSFFLSEKTEAIYGSARVYIFSPDSTDYSIEVNKTAHGKSDYEAHNNVRNIDYSYKFSGDTLYLDEYYSVKPGEEWNGSKVEIIISGKKGTVIKSLPDLNSEILGMHYNRNFLPLFKISEDGIEELEE